MLIGENISVSCLSSWDKFDCTSKSPIPSTYLPVLPSFSGSADSSISHFFLSGCRSCPGCVDSSSVSCRRSVLLRHGHWSDACTLSADGQATILSHTSFFLKFSLPSKVYFCPIPQLLQHSISLSLWSVSISIPLHSWPCCCWEADRKKDWERETDKKHTEPSLQGFCSESLPAKPKASQSVLTLLFMCPQLRLHLDFMPACDDVPLCMDKTVHDF